MQSWLVGLIVFAATVYLGRAAWLTLRPARTGQDGKNAGCAAGCGGCGESSTGMVRRPLVTLQGLEGPCAEQDSKQDGR